jgi:hypothetical protein
LRAVGLVLELDELELDPHAPTTSATAVTMMAASGARNFRVRGPRIRRY